MMERLVSPHPEGCGTEERKDTPGFGLGCGEPSRPTTSGLRHRLRPYQVEAGRAIARSVFRRRGDSISVMMARQAGKNELSAQLELLLLVAHMLRSVDAIKCAPTFEPQARISMRRLWARLSEAGLASFCTREEGHVVRVGQARQVFLSAEPESNVVGHTAHLLLEVDEAQDVDNEKFDKEFRPMAAVGQRDDRLLRHGLGRHHPAGERARGTWSSSAATASAATSSTTGRRWPSTIPPTAATWRASGSAWARTIPSS